MRRNRRKKEKAAVVLTRPGMLVTWLILAIFIAAMIFWYQGSSCDQLKRDIGKAEKKLQELEEACKRETAKWNELNTVDGLREAIVRFGLDMHEPNPDQVIRMGRDGRPLAGQMSLAKLPKGEQHVEKRVSRETPTFNKQPMKGGARNVRKK